jgi:MFS family permease
VLLSLHAGVVVDRLDRRRVMVWADLGRFAVLVAVAVLILTAQVNLVWLVLAAFLLGIGQVFFDIARGAERRPQESSPLLLNSWGGCSRRADWW